MKHVRWMVAGLVLILASGTVNAAHLPFAGISAQAQATGGSGGFGGGSSGGGGASGSW